jgi:hypothetical protein
MKSFLQTLAFAAGIPAVFVGLALLIGLSNGASLGTIFPSAGLPAVLAVLALWVGLFLLQWAVEFRKWNNGICRSNGARWQLDWSDSGGGRKYSAGGHALMVNNWFVGH